MSVKGYRIRPNWRRIGIAVALVLYATVGAFAVGWVVDQFTGWISNSEHEYVYFGYELGHWVLGFDILFAGPILIGILALIGWGLANILFDIEKQGDSA